MREIKDVDMSTKEFILKILNKKSEYGCDKDGYPCVCDNHFEDVANEIVLFKYNSVLGGVGKLLPNDEEIVSKSSIPELKIQPKPKLIIGKRSSGKGFLAKNISFGFYNTITLNGADFLYNGRFSFSIVKADTDLIIIDDVPEKDLRQVGEIIEGNICIERRGEEPFKIKTPQIIIISEIEEGDIGPSIKKRFDIIKTHIDKSEGFDPVFFVERV